MKFTCEDYKDTNGNLHIQICKQLSEQNHLQFPYWQVECDAASHILQIYHASCTSWIKLFTSCHLPPRISSSQRIQPQYKGTKPSPCWCSARRSTPFRKIPDKMTFREISDKMIKYMFIYLHVSWCLHLILQG